MGYGFGLALVFLPHGSSATERPFAKVSHCFVEVSPKEAISKGQEIYLLLEKTTADEWVYSSMTMSFADLEAFDLFDGGNVCAHKIVAAEQRFECKNLNTENKTSLSVGLNFEKLLLKTKKEIFVGDSDDNKPVAPSLSPGQHQFELVDLEICTSRL